jgi:ubiquinone/menaquinone biosynthesis C-methylase UbiE
MTVAAVEAHYAVAGLGDAILRALADDGKDLDALTPADLAPVDEFHLRGREATLELAGLARLEPSLFVLDVGSGLGGSARHLAATYGCHVTGVDATKDYCDAATMLSRRVGLGDRTRFRHGSALALPFGDRTFDVAWTEHVQMNIADKRTFYTEIARVLRPGGRLVFHDVFQGPGGAPHYPVPWAGAAELSHLARPNAVAAILGALGFVREEWRDVTDNARRWIAQRAAKGAARPRTGFGLLMGEQLDARLGNVCRNLDEDRIAVVQAAWRLR